MKNELQTSENFRAPEPARTVEHGNGNCAIQSQPLMALGATLITAKARGVLHPQEVLAALYRHACGGSKFSVQPAASGVTVRIVTEEDGSETVVSLASELESADAGLVDGWICNSGCPSCG